MLVLGLGLIGCEGPQGPQGEQGPKGEQGEQGPRGEEGTANIIYSNWMDANWNYVDELDRKVMRIPIDQIDYSDLRNNSMVMVYIRNYGDSSVYSLPGSGRWDMEAILYSFRFGDNQESQRGLLISVESLDGTDLREIEYSAENGTVFRYILVSDSVQNKMSSGFWEDYEAVAEYYALAEEGGGHISSQ